MPAAAAGAWLAGLTTGSSTGLRPISSATAPTATRGDAGSKCGQRRRTAHTTRPASRPAPMTTSTTSMTTPSMFAEMKGGVNLIPVTRSRILVARSGLVAPNGVAARTGDRPPAATAAGVFSRRLPRDQRGHARRRPLPTPRFCSMPASGRGTSTISRWLADNRTPTLNDVTKYRDVHREHRGGGSHRGRRHVRGL